MHCKITEHVGVRSVLCRFMTHDLKVFLYYLRKWWGQAEIAWKSTRPLQTTNPNSRKPSTVLSLWADLVLQSRPQVGLVVKCSNEFRNISEIKNLTHKLQGACERTTEMVCCPLRLSVLSTGSSAHTDRLNGLFIFHLQVQKGLCRLTC